MRCDDVRVNDIHDSADSGSLLLHINTHTHTHTVYSENPGIPNVFILYHKERSLQGISPEDFSQNVLDLANALNACGGLVISLDMYETASKGNWNKWTEDKIRQSQFVLLVCSPMLYQALERAGQDIVDMEKGSFFANSVINLVHPEKFIPVFFENCRPPDLTQWIPGSNLALTTKYVLNMEEFAQAIDVPEGSSPQALHQQIGQALGMPQFEEWVKLIAHLRGESYVSRSTPAYPPIQLPPPRPHGEYH